MSSEEDPALEMALRLSLEEAARKGQPPQQFRFPGGASQWQTEDEDAALAMALAESERQLDAHAFGSTGSMQVGPSGPGASARGSFQPGPSKVNGKHPVSAAAPPRPPPPRPRAVAPARSSPAQKPPSAMADVPAAKRPRDEPAEQPEQPEPKKRAPQTCSTCRANGKLGVILKGHTCPYAAPKQPAASSPAAQSASGAGPSAAAPAAALAAAPAAPAVPTAAAASSSHLSNHRRLQELQRGWDLDEDPKPAASAAASAASAAASAASAAASSTAAAAADSPLAAHLLQPVPSAAPASRLVVEGLQEELRRSKEREASESKQRKAAEQEVRRLKQELRSGGGGSNEGSSGEGHSGAGHCAEHSEVLAPGSSSGAGWDAGWDASWGAGNWGDRARIENPRLGSAMWKLDVGGGHWAAGTGRRALDGGHLDSYLIPQRLGELD